jgi:hypothetical protein
MDRDNMIAKLKAEADEALDPRLDDRPRYVTEDGQIVHEGDLVYDYYGMEPVIIGKPSGSQGDDPWFDVIKPGSVTEDRPHGVRGSSGMLNGARICTIAYAKRRGFTGAEGM